MSWRRKIGTAAVVGASCLLLAAGAPLAAQRPGPGRGPGIGPGGPHGFGGPGARRGPGLMRELMIEHLDLSDEQITEIHATHQLWAEEGEELHRRLWSRRDLLREASRAEPLDEEAVRSAAMAVAEVEVELAVHRARVLSEARALLTEEQRAELRSLQERIGERRERMRGHLRGRWSEGAE